MKIFNKYTFLVLLLITGLYACKKDLGNYTYHTVDAPVADTAGLTNAYNVLQYANLTINPVIHYGGDTSNLSYQWITYVKSLSSPAIGPATVISTKRNLNLNVTTPPGTYYLEFIITDKTNALKTTSRTLLNVQATIETGWLVLHSLNNQSDVDFIASTNLSPTGPNKRLSNLFQSVIGSKMKGEGQTIGYSRRSNSLFNYITVGTDQSIERVNGFTFALMGADNALFRRAPSALNLQAFINSGSNDVMINNGLLQVLPWGVIQDAFYNEPWTGDYSLAPYIVFNSSSLYGALVYDQKYQKFMYTTQSTGNFTFVQFLPSVVTTPAQPFNPLSVGKKMLFMDRGFTNYAYAFFQDNTGGGRYMYVLNQTTADAGKQAVAAYDMSALTDIANAKYFQVGDLGNVALYATDNTVYRFDYSGTKLATVDFNVPAGETITCMRIFKPIYNPNAPTTEFTLTNNAVIYVATWDGTQGKLYELGMNVASGIINPAPLKIYTGFGKIKDMTAKFRGTGT